MKKRLFIIVGIVVVAAFVVGGVVKWANGPAVATLSTKPNGDVKGESVGLQTFDAEYYDTKIPDIFKLKTRTESAESPVAGQYLFVGKDKYSSDQLAITIGSSKTSALDQVSLVKFRLAYPDEYQQTVPEAGFPEGSIVFVKRNGYEKSVFWIEEGRYAGVVASGSLDRKPQLDNSVQSAIINWQWK